MNNQETPLEQVVGTMNILRDISEGTAPEEVYLAMQDEGLMVVNNEWVIVLAEVMDSAVNKGMVIGTLGTLIGLGAMKWVRKIL